MPPPLLENGFMLHVVDGDQQPLVWTVKQSLGAGTNGSVFMVEGGRRGVTAAAKIEWADQSHGLETERTVLKMIADLRPFPDGRDNFCTYIAYGSTVCGRFRMLVMTLTGPSLDQLRKETIGKRFCLATIGHLARQLLRALEALHSLEYVNRDIKPKNMAVSLEDRARVVLLDFGLAKKYTTSSRQLRAPSTKTVPFRGTDDFGSLSALLGGEQTRLDDLESLCWALLELHFGGLPWSGMVRARNIAMKQRAHTDLRSVFFGQSLPAVFVDFLTALKSTSWAVTPNYSAMRQLWSDGAPTYRQLEWMSGDGHGQQQQRKTTKKARKTTRRHR